MIAGIGAACWALGFGLVALGLPVILGWISAPTATTTWAATLRMTGIVWLAAQHAPVEAGGVTISLLPLGLMLIPALLLLRAGRWAARAAHVRTLRQALRVTLIAAISYAALAAVTAAIASTTGLEARPGPAALAAGALCLVALGAGVLRAAGLVPRVLRRLPEVVRLALAGGVAGTASLVALAAVAAGVAVAVRLPAAASVAGGLAPGPVAGVLLALLGIAYAPVAVIWALAYLLGPGFAVGGGTTVSVLSGAGGTALPAFPLATAVPSSAPPGIVLLAATPVLAGVIAGLVMARRDHARHPSAGRGLTMALGAGLVAGVLVGVLAWLSRGSLGDQRLASLGPQPMLCAVAAAGLIALGALLGAQVPHGTPVLWSRGTPGSDQDASS